MKYIYIHCHLDFPDYEIDKKEVLERMVEQDVAAISIGTDLESSKRAIEIAEGSGKENNKSENKIWAVIGVHPVLEPQENKLEKREVDRGLFEESEFEKLVQSSKVVAIGECGLDFFRLNKLNEEELKIEKERQIKIFKQQIEFALKHDKPLMLHCRNAYEETLEILEEYKKAEGDKLRGDVHFFAGNTEQAKRFVDLGFSCSFTGVITFTNDYDEVIKSLPLESIMSETDSPFATPVPHRGKRNEPIYVLEVIKRLAELKGLKLEEMATILRQNAERLFSIEI